MHVDVTAVAETSQLRQQDITVTPLLISAHVYKNAVCLEGRRDTLHEGQRGLHMELNAETFAFALSYICR